MLDSKCYYLIAVFMVIQANTQAKPNLKPTDGLLDGKKGNGHAHLR